MTARKSLALPAASPAHMNRYQSPDAWGYPPHRAMSVARRSCRTVAPLYIIVLSAVRFRVWWGSVRFRVWWGSVLRFLQSCHRLRTSVALQNAGFDSCTRMMQSRAQTSCTLDTPAKNKDSDPQAAVRILTGRRLPASMASNEKDAADQYDEAIAAYGAALQRPTRRIRGGSGSSGATCSRKYTSPCGGASQDSTGGAR